MSKKKLIIGGVVIAVLLIILAFSIFSGGKSSGTTQTSPAGIQQKVFVSPQDQSAQDQLLSILKGLQGIKLDGQIFDREAFKQLADFSVPLVPQPTGRNNPFAPINPFEQFGDQTITLPITPPPATHASTSTPPTAAKKSTTSKTH